MTGIGLAADNLGVAPERAEEEMGGGRNRSVVFHEIWKTNLSLRRHLGAIAKFL